MLSEALQHFFIVERGPTLPGRKTFHAMSEISINDLQDCHTVFDLCHQPLLCNFSAFPGNPAHLCQGKVNLNANALLQSSK
jgi:hypothetical protein